ncbi:MAG: spore germination protein [Clostridiales bacterium]|jgi:spore germination protein KB|nr:spore germination protein [Clostridiales bacterium]
MDQPKQVSAKQFALIVFLAAVAIQLFMLPGLVMRVTGRDSYMVMFAVMLLEGVNLFFILAILKRNPDKTCFQILTDCAGKIAARVIAVLFGLFAFFKLMLIIGEIHMFFAEAVFEEFSWNIMVLPLLMILYLAVRKTLRTIGRLAEILVPLVFISGVTMCVLLTPPIEFVKLLPVLEQGPAPVFESLWQFPVWYLDMPFLLIFLGNVKLSKKCVPGSVVTFVLATVMVVVMPLVLYSTHSDIRYLVNYGHNASRLTSHSAEMQEFGRFDIMLYCLWILGIFLHMCITFSALIVSAEYVIGVRGRRRTVNLCALAVVYVLSVTLFMRPDFLYGFFTGPIRLVVVPVPLLLPLFLFICARVKYKPHPSPYHHEIDKRRKKTRHETQKAPSQKG